MLVKTTGTVREIRDRIFKSSVFGNPKYAAVVNEHSRFYIFEEYTLRNGNYMTISVMIEEKEEYRLIHYVVSGAAQGILGITWGANSARENRLIKQLEFHNFDYEVIENA